MARTKASVGQKMASGKSSKARKVGASAAPTPSTSKGRSRSSAIGGNPYFPRETPSWQKSITKFFPGHQSPVQSDGEQAGSSKAEPKKKKKNVITSDTESDNEDAAQRDAELPDPAETSEMLDASTCSQTDLPPLEDDETCHKIKDYFTSNKKNESAFEVQEDVIKVKLPATKNKGKGKKSGEDDEENGVINDKTVKNKGKGKGKGKGKKASAEENKDMNGKVETNDVVENGKLKVLSADNVSNVKGDDERMDCEVEVSGKENLKPDKEDKPISNGKTCKRILDEEPEVANNKKLKITA